MSNLLQVPVDQSATVPCAEADARLMRRLAAGDPAAMPELIAIHGDRLARLVGRMTAWSGDRDDLLQDVLVSAWEQAGSYEGHGSLAGWLRMIAVNRCRNHHRTRRTLARLLDAARQRIGGPEPDKDFLEISELTRQALQQLAVDDRTVMVLVYLEELPGPEVARLLNIKPETLHVRLHRARRRLKRILEQLDV